MKLVVIVIITMNRELGVITISVKVMELLMTTKSTWNVELVVIIKKYRGYGALSLPFKVPLKIQDNSKPTTRGYGAGGDDLKRE